MALQSTRSRNHEAEIPNPCFHVSSANKYLYDHDRIIQDMEGNILAATSGFYEKYFEGKSWSATAEKAVSEYDLSIAKQLFDAHPGFPSVKNVLQATQKLLEPVQLLEKKLHYTLLHQASSCQCSRPADSLVLSYVADENSDNEQPESVVIGVFCAEDSMNYREGLMQLLGDARAAFVRQPDRLFLHGFYIFGEAMECWVFDRSGIYSCQPISLTADPKKFWTVIIAYALMSDEERGSGNLVKDDSEGRYVTYRTVHHSGKMYLQTPPFFVLEEDDLVGGGLTCHRGKNTEDEQWGFVVKYKWKPDYHESEAKQLKLANEKNVWGVVQLFSYEVLTNTENLRCGLVFGRPKKFKAIDVDVTSLNESSVSSSVPTQIHKLVSSSVPLSETEVVRPVVGVAGLLEDSNEDRPNHPKDAGYRSTNFSCLIIFPPGIPLYDYSGLPQLLEALRDAIKAHRSLYQTAGILHRDIAASNIIIPPPSQAVNSPKGMLIDLDTAWDTARGNTPQGSLVGTSPFMAIGALEAFVKNNPRTYRHDLEAFLNVFIFLAICSRTAEGTKCRELPATSRLLKWKLDKREQFRKTEDMGEEGFRKVLDEFSPEFEGLKGLAERLRACLFPLVDGKIWTWTDNSEEGTNKLYDDMIQAFEDEISVVSRL